MLAALLGLLWVAAVSWGYEHAVTLEAQRMRLLHAAVTRARDMQRMRDVSQIRACQTRVMMDDLHMGTDIMIAHAALKQAGMAQ